MFYILYPFYAIASILFSALTYALSPILPLFMKSDGNLPRWLSWFQTFDNTLLAGKTAAFGWTGSDYSLAARWLRRNPGYTFDYYPLGVAWDTSQWTVTKNTDTVFIVKGPNGHFCYKYSGSKFELKFGWKAWAGYDRENNKWTDFQWGPAKRIPVCFTIKKA